MKRRLIAALAIALLLVATLSLPAIAADEQTVGASVTVTSVISITITDEGATGVTFGSQTSGDDYPDTAANSTTSSIILNVGSETSIYVDLQMSGDNFTSGSNIIGITNAKYSLTFAGAKTAMSTSYTEFADNVAPGGFVYYIWHWLTVPSGTAAGAYTSTFRYKAVPHS
jgi:hypothetical protein